MRPNYNKTIDRLYVSQEFFWSKKEDKYDQYEISFMLSGWNGNNSEESCSDIKDIVTDLYGEDKDDSWCNAYWNYQDIVYNYMYYSNPNTSFSPGEIRKLITNVDKFFTSGEKASVDAFKRNLNKKTDTYVFKLKQGITKQEFSSELSESLRNVLRDIDDKEKEVLEELESNSDPTKHVVAKKKILVDKIEYYVKEIEKLGNTIYDKITKSPKIAE